MIDEYDFKLKGFKYPSDLIERIYRSLIKLIGNEKITPLNVVIISTNLMQLVEGYPTLRGLDKKSLVIHILKRVVSDNIDGEIESSLILFIETFLPSVIDTIISVDRKELSVKIKKSFKSCFPMC
jgi:hypothetical protein